MNVHKSEPHHHDDTVNRSMFTNWKKETDTLHMNVQKSEPPPRRRYIIIGEHSQIVEKENDAFHMNVQ